jgi:hypothetical protein
MMVTITAAGLGDQHDGDDYCRHQVIDQMAAIIFAAPVQ